MIYLDEPDLDYIPSTKGEDVRRFERAVAEYLGVDDCVATNSGTSALHLALLARGIGRGDTVVVPATTFVATANAVLYTGAKVKLVDIDFDTWCLPERLYRDHTICVALYGSNVKLNFSVKARKSLIWDLSHALFTGTTVQKFGGHYGIYSLNGNKLMTTGGGGIITGKNLDIIRELIKPGQSKKLAYNYGMPALNASMGLKELEKLPDRLKKREEFDSIYRNELSFLKFQKVESQTPCWKTAAIFPEWVNVEKLQIQLLGRDIQSGRVFKPLYNWPQFKTPALIVDLRRFPNADYLYRHGLELPGSLKHDIDDIYTVCKMVKELI